MKYVFVIAALLCAVCIFMSSQKPNYPQPVAITVYHGTHSYICFDGKFYIHDPDCRCDAEWATTTIDPENKIVSRSKHFRRATSHYD